MSLPDTLTAVDVFSPTCDAPGTGEEASQALFARALQTILNNTYYLSLHSSGTITEAQLRAAAAALTAALSVNGKTVSNAADPVSAQDLVTLNYFNNNGAQTFPATPSAGTDTTMFTIGPLADNTIYVINVELTARDSGNNLHSAFHAQKWARVGGGPATLIQSMDPVQVAGISGVTATASRLIAGGTGNNSVLGKFNPAVATRYYPNVYVNSYPLAHI